MQQIHVNAGGGYDILIGRGLLDSAGKAAAGVLMPQAAAGGSAETVHSADDAAPAAAGAPLKLAVFTDSTVGKLYADRVEKSLAEAGFETCRYEYQAGEKQKNISTVTDFVEFMSARHMTRRDAVVVVGGGVAGDMGGFAASVYLRGIRFIQIPTSLLAAVDSSVGGKTGVDTARGKNLMGTFWQPSLVICDTAVFESLNDDLILDGMAEVIKTAAIRDAEFFGRIESACSGAGLSGPGAARGFLAVHADEIVKECVTIKGSVVEADEKESGLRRILNFGHTMAHSIEKHACYGISHGKAVAIGMLMVTRASEYRGITESGTYERLYDLTGRLGYVREYDAPTAELCRIAENDKKTAGGSIALVCLRRIGEAEIADVKLSELATFYNRRPPRP